MKKPKNRKIFSGSYHPNDCDFLLQEANIKPISTENKEIFLQQSNIHYSKMISNEAPMQLDYLKIFYKLVDFYCIRLASQLKLLAKKIYKSKGSHITVVSLARAGTPIGVLVTRALKTYHTTDVKHYSISIIRDRGIDVSAIQHISKSGRSSKSIIFVDGWTAKGTINLELKKAVLNWNSNSNYKIGSELCVISDLSGNAEFIATIDDYAIPSSILNSTISGLISRTLMLDEVSGFHQCLYYKHLISHDLSNWFITKISSSFDSAPCANDKITHKWQQSRQIEVANFIKKIMYRFGVSDINKIKPGVAEATRVMLRRVPRILIVRDIKSFDVAHLMFLAHNKKILIEEDHKMPFVAIAIIENIKGYPSHDKKI